MFRGATGTAVVALVVLLLLWLTGTFHDKVEHRAARPVLRAAPNAATLTVTPVDTPVYETAVGTIRPIAEARVGARILAHVAKMHIEKAGQSVTRGQVLAELDDTDLKARLEEAKAALRAAEAELAQARTDLERTEKLFAERVVPQDRLDRDRTRVTAGVATVERLQQTIAGAETALGFATIRAPIDGIVIDKQVNKGDLVSPGQTVVTMYDPTRLQLIAIVRERLAARLQIGGEVDVHLQALDAHCQGRIDQIVPEARAGSRSFEVKVTGPCHPGVLSGMFGRMRVLVGSRREIRIPRAAVLGVGQLDFVFVALDGGRVLRRFVRLGDESDGAVEVLAGLTGGERVFADAGAVQ